MDRSPPGSSVHGIILGRILEWDTIPFSRRFPDPRLEPKSPASPELAGRFFTTEPPGKPEIPQRVSFDSIPPPSHPHMQTQSASAVITNFLEVADQLSQPWPQEGCPRPVLLLGCHQNSLLFLHPQVGMVLQTPTEDSKAQREEDTAQYKEQRHACLG